MDIVQFGQLLPQGRKPSEDEQLLIALAAVLQQERSCHCGGNLVVREIDKRQGELSVYWRCTRHGDVRGG